VKEAALMVSCPQSPIQDGLIPKGSIGDEHLDLFYSQLPLL
jgi:hypothetical protein